MEDHPSDLTWQDEVLQRLRAGSAGVHEKDGCLHQRLLAAATPQPQLTVVLVVRGHSCRLDYSTWLVLSFYWPQSQITFLVLAPGIFGSTGAEEMNKIEIDPQGRHRHT